MTDTRRVTLRDGSPREIIEEVSMISHTSNSMTTFLAIKSIERLPYSSKDRVYSSGIFSAFVPISIRFQYIIILKSPDPPLSRVLLSTRFRCECSLSLERMTAGRGPIGDINFTCNVPRPFIARRNAANRKARSHNGYDRWCIGPVGTPLGVEALSHLSLALFTISRHRASTPILLHMLKFVSSYRIPLLYSSPIIFRPIFTLSSTQWHKMPLSLNWGQPTYLLCY